MLLSDQGWLWARGFEGGGPHVQLYRRIAHWLMRQPELEEERLTAEADGSAISILRQTMADDAGTAQVITPSGKRLEAPLTGSGNGLFTARVETGETGLFQIANGDLTALVHVGNVDTPEMRTVTSTTQTLAALTRETGGTTLRLAPRQDIGTDATPVLPSIVPVHGTAAAGEDWIGLRPTSDTVLRSVDRRPLFSGLAALAALLMLLASTWYREGR